MPDPNHIPRRSVVDQAFEAMRARILHGHWAPGDAVPTEKELTEALGVSRSTVREALNRLASGGLIHIPHGGTKRVLDWRDHAGIEVLADLFVDPDGRLNHAVVRSAVEMRAAIAPDVARLAARHRQDAQADALVRIAASLDPKAELESLLVATLEWWTLLVLASDNLGYRLAYNTLRHTYTEGREPMREVIAEELRAARLYQSIAAAVQRRDPSTAREQCEVLVSLGTRAMFAALAALHEG
ncbi:MAG: FadR family transcriptional regulator [Deltaproteobacteria bacterium]|nr:MAG: FadR family transcriptional regulator [Deltaproteobacteria bacterium]